MQNMKPVPQKLTEIVTMMNQEENGKEISSLGHKLGKTKTAFIHFLKSALSYLWISLGSELWITQPQIKINNLKHEVLDVCLLFTSQRVYKVSTTIQPINQSINHGLLINF